MDNELAQAKIKALLAGYNARWKDAGYEAVAIEKVLTSPLWNPETDRQSRSFTVAGKLDVIVRYEGRLFVMDHKTTSQDISDPDAAYWRQLVVEGQASHYLMQMWLAGHKADGAIWDVIRKPSIAPKKLSKAELASVMSSGTYFGQRVSADERLALNADPDHRESPELYRMRLENDCIEVRPEWYFQRRTYPRLDTELMEYASELWGHSQDILAARRNERWPRNSGACLLYGTACKFLGVCSGHDEITSDRWRKAETVHEELGGEAPENALTNSRIRCFQTCRRKHHFEYELGVERHDEEEKEALQFGTALHSALAEWWSQFLPIGDDHDDGCDRSPVDSAGKQAALVG